VYVATGNPGSCSSAEPFAEALVKLRASDLTVLSSWQIPTADQVSDGDFGAAPTLFSGTVKHGGAQRSLVGIPNKNGIYYVFDRSMVSAGPVARLQMAIGGDCPLCGKGGLAPSAWDGTTLYVAGGNTTINGISYQGGVRAWNPNNLSSPLWQVGLADGPVLGAVLAAPGLVAVGEGSYTVVLSASDGNVLLKAPVNSLGTGNAAVFYGAPSIAYGNLFEGDTNGELYAYAISATSTTPLTITTSSLPAATVGQPYTQTLQADGGTHPYAWSIVGGSLPAGLTLDASTGTISGTPTSPGNVKFTVGVTDASAPSQSATRALRLQVKPH
jgi:hypothetical protein